MGIQATGTSRRFRGISLWEGQVTDDSHDAVLKLLTDAMENGWPVSWLPELAESVHILAFNMRTINALDVTTYASSTREYMPPSTWLLTVHFR